MTLSVDGRHWTVGGRLASNSFVREVKTQTACFGAIDLVISAEEVTCEAVTQIVSQPVRRRRGIVARLFLPFQTPKKADVLAAFSHWNSERNAPNAPDLALPLVIFAPSIELQCLKALTAATIRGGWRVVGFDYLQLNKFATLVSELERLIGRAPDFSITNPRVACFMDLRSIGFVCGYEKAVLSMRDPAAALYAAYPDLSKTYNPARIKEPWGPRSAL